MKKSMLYSIGMIVFAVILYCVHLSVDNFSLQIKLGFMSKILLIIGVISLWLFGISDVMKHKNDSK